MKKNLLILVVTFVLTLSVSSNNAFAENKFGVGYQGTFIGEFLNGLSVRGWFDSFSVDATLFHTDVEADGADSDLLNLFILDGRFLYAPIVKENSRFYMGANLGYGALEVYDEDLDLLTYGLLLGTEYSFQGLPELGFNWEVGYKFNTLDTDEYDFEVDLNGISVSLGVHYYF